MEGEAQSSEGSSEDVRRQLRELTSQVGPWTGHNIELAPGVFTRGPGPGGDEVRYRLIKRLAVDLLHRPLASARVLDLGALEGQYGIELALEGAEVVFLEGREESAEKIRFALNALGIERASVRTEDVRNLTRSRHGAFDVVLCIGLLYHLDQAGVFGLIRSMREVCTDLLILDTHVAREDGEIARHRHEDFWVDPRQLSAMREIEIDGQRYRGRDFIEHSLGSSPDERQRAAWASLDNVTSFWPTMPSLVNALSAAGFTTVLEPIAPRLHWPPDRRLLVAKAGQEVQLRSTSVVVDDYPLVPEWQPTKAGARRIKPAAIGRLIKRVRQG